MPTASVGLCTAPPSYIAARALALCRSLSPDASIICPGARSSVVDPQLLRFDSSQFGTPEPVRVREGDRILRPAQWRAIKGTGSHPHLGGPKGHAGGRQAARGAPAFALMKLDVEGFECSALRGMRRLLSAGEVRTMKVEVFDGALRAQVRCMPGAAGVAPPACVAHYAGLTFFASALHPSSNVCSPLLICV